MSLNTITVKPERSRLVAFARWATAQNPKVRTVGLAEFSVPADLYVLAPEEVLIGALVDGHRYVSPSEDDANGQPEPTGPEPAGAELLGVANPEALSDPEDPAADAAALVAAVRPETIQAAMDAVLIATDLAASNAAARGDGGDDGQALDFAPLEDAPAEVPDPDGPITEWVCGQCPREFTTERGRDSHRRQAHRED
ncbi:hypothetical protein [Streptomyces cadmiisoli]|uniref:hypothetical protein n=1 Tax=Streptomyces cadmiisoli TaxID=2184053 RepID=UPI003667BBB5